MDHPRARRVPQRRVVGQPPLRRERRAALAAVVRRPLLAALLRVREEQELGGERGRGALLARVGLVALVVVAHVPEQPLVRAKVHLAHLAVERPLPLRLLPARLVPDVPRRALQPLPLAADLLPGGFQVDRGKVPRKGLPGDAVLRPRVPVVVARLAEDPQANLAREHGPPVRQRGLLGAQVVQVHVALEVAEREEGHGAFGTFVLGAGVQVSLAVLSESVPHNQRLVSELSGANFTV